VAAALDRTATPLACPPDWEPLTPEDERTRCYGNASHTSFFGHGLVDARCRTTEQASSGTLISVSRPTKAACCMAVW
jgi:hypothetical protein